jgi:hypothetical protein
MNYHTHLPVSMPVSMPVIWNTLFLPIFKKHRHNSFLEILGVGTFISLEKGCTRSPCYFNLTYRTDDRFSIYFYQSKSVLKRYR